MTEIPALQAEAMVVHLFVAANGRRQEAARTYLGGVWTTGVGERLGMTERLPNAAVGIEPNFDDVPGAPIPPLLAARMRSRSGDQPTSDLEAALLRRRGDTFCLTVMREPPLPPRNGWGGLDTEWSTAAEGRRPLGAIGEVRLYLARLVGPGRPEPDDNLAAAVRAHYQLGHPAGEWWAKGIVVPPGFAVWETSAPEDGRALRRRIIVVAAANEDAALSRWAWVDSSWGLPQFGRYLLHAAKLRYQHGVWVEAEQRFRQAREDADTKVDKLLMALAPQPGSGSRAAELSDVTLRQASRDLMFLQANERGLVVTSTRLREMCRTVQIAADNMATHSGDNKREVDDQLGGLFAEDRDLGAWFAQQLDDDATYLEAAEKRVGHVAAWTDQLVRQNLQRRQERLQRRQEHVNLALTGVIGAILMVLAAIQSLQYTVPLPPLVIPAVVTTLGAVALLASLVVLRVAVPDQTWTRWLVWVGVGATTATATWVAVSAITGDTAPTAWLAAAGFVVGVGGAALAPRLVPRRTQAEPDPDHAPV